MGKAGKGFIGIAMASPKGWDTHGLKNLFFHFNAYFTLDFKFNLDLNL